MASRFWVGGTGTWDAADTTHWSGSSGGAGGQSVPVAADTVTLDGSSGGGTVTVNTDFSVTSVTMGAFTGTLDFSANNNSPTMQTFSCSGTGTRTLNMGSGTWNISSTAATTVWDTSTSTNLTLSPNTSTVNLSGNGLSGSRTVTCNSVPLNNISVSAGSISTTFTNTVAVNYDFTGSTGPLNNSVGMVVNGNLTLSVGMSVVSGSNVLTFSPTSGTKLITTNSIQINRPITVNATAGAGVQVIGALDMTGASARTLTLTQGNFDANNNNISVAIFSSSNSNTRTLTMGSGTWTITGNNATVWSMATTTNLTVTANTATVNFTYSGSTGTRFVNGAGSGNRLGDNWNFSAGSDTITMTSSGFFAGNVSFSGFTGTYTGNQQIKLDGNLTLGTGMTSTSTGNLLFSATSGTQTITRNSVALANLVNFTGAGGTFVFADSFLTSSTITLNNGTLNGNNQNITALSFASSNSNVRTLRMGSGTWNVRGTGTVWDTSTTGGNFTLDSGTSTILVNDSSASTKTFRASNSATTGAGTYYNLRFSGTGTGTFIMGTGPGNSGLAYNNITVDTPPHTLQIFAGNTIIANSVTWSGTAGSLNTFQSTTNGAAWTISVASGTVTENYISLQDSTATGGATFYAGNHSTNVSGNTGWLFLNPPLTVSENASRDQNHVPTLLGSDSTDPTKTVTVYANPSTHALSVNDTTDGSNQGGSIAPRDANHVPAILAVSSADGITPVVVYMDSTTNELLITSS